MRIAILLSSIVLLVACRTEPEKPLPPAERPMKDTKYASILAKCKSITIDTLPVYGFEYKKDDLEYNDDSASFEEMRKERDAYLYKGIPMDSAEVKLFPAAIAEASFGGGGDISGCYSFAMDDSHTGIIARTPAMYDATSIKLFTLDNERDTITDFVELAEVWGDAGGVVKKQSWLYRDTKMNLHAYMWIRESYDHSVEDEKDTTVERNEYHYVFDLSKPRHDTVDRNAGNLLKTFQAVNHKPVYK